jgi:toxin ParE1/3/4
LNVRWTATAAKGWEDAFDFLAQENLDAALRTAESVLNLADMLAIHPYAGRAGRVAGTRELVVSGTPFLIAYGVSTEDETVWIYAVYHGRRRWPKQFSKS